MKTTNKIGEGDFECDDHEVSQIERRTQLAWQEERIKQAFRENEEAERETKKKLNSNTWDGEDGDTGDSTDNRKHQVFIETGVESLSQQIVESLLSTLAREGEDQQDHGSRLIGWL